jgi:hypothetical protein
MGLANLLPDLVRTGLCRHVDRLQLFETPEFSQVKASNDEAKLPIVEMFHKYTSNVLLGLGRGMSMEFSSTYLRSLQ